MCNPAEGLPPTRGEPHYMRWPGSVFTPWHTCQVAIARISSVCGFLEQIVSDDLVPLSGRGDQGTDDRGGRQAE